MQLYGSAQDVQCKLIEFESFFKTRASVKSLSKQISFMNPIIMSYLNQKLDQGIQLPLPSGWNKLVES